MSRTMPHKACRYCGKRLRMLYNTTYKRTATKRPALSHCIACDSSNLISDGEGEFKCGDCGRAMAVQFIRKVVSRVPTFERPGYLGNGYFCTLTCGYRYAVKAVQA